MTFVQTESEVPAGSSGRRPLRTGVLQLGLAHLVAAALIALVWLAWAPSTRAFVVPITGGGTVLIPEESESQIAGDGRFLLLSAVAGLALGFLAWRARGVRGPMMPVLLAVMGVIGSALARGIGSVLASGHKTGLARTIIETPLSLHAAQMLWLQALIAVLTYTAMAGLTSDPDLG
jgi:hypothetical protein